MPKIYVIIDIFPQKIDSLVPINFQNMYDKNFKIFLEHIHLDIQNDGVDIKTPKVCFEIQAFQMNESQQSNLTFRRPTRSNDF